MCQCFHNISLECGVGEGRTMQCVGTLDIGQHTQVFVHTVQPPEKDIKTLYLNFVLVTSLDRHHTPGRPDTEYTVNLPLIDPNCTSYFIYYLSNQPRRRCSKGVNGFFRKFSQYSEKASLKTSIQISLFLNNYYNQVFLLKCYLVLSTRTRTQGVFSKLVLNLVDTFTAPPLAIRTGLRVFIAEAPAPHHQPGGDEHHDGLPAPGRFHGHHHLPHVPRHREDLQ